MNHALSRLAALLATLTLLTACVYVEETAESRTVRVVPAAETKNCTSLGKIKVSVLRVGRSEEIWREDLIRLARNNAAKNGADTIAAAGEPVNEEQTFDMYRCVGP